MQQIVIPIGCDHAGFELKQVIIKHLQDKGFSVNDQGCFSNDSIDYADYAHPVATLVENNPGMKGILLCGSGNGISMTANKHEGIRAGLCWRAEVTEFTRSHNDANVICIPARYVPIELAKEMLEIFMTTAFEGGRHQNRVTKISCA
jgi:ribose 5-phosphate isomerase B